jgi:hypothetical protein
MTTSATDGGLLESKTSSRLREQGRDGLDKCAFRKLNALLFATMT